MFVNVWWLCIQTRAELLYILIIVALESTLGSKLYVVLVGTSS